MRDGKNQAFIRLEDPAKYHYQCECGESSEIPAIASVVFCRCGQYFSMPGLIELEVASDEIEEDD